MALYNIQLRSETHVWVTETVDQADHAALRVEVARFVGQLLRQHAGKIWEDQAWRVDVTDERGLILYYMSISAAETAATMSRPPKGY